MQFSSPLSLFTMAAHIRLMLRPFTIFAALAAATSIPALASVTLTAWPDYASVRTGLTQQFKTAISGATGETVYWRVNGISGGNSTIGWISTTGLYTAPATVPGGATVAVTASAAHAPDVTIIVTITTGLSHFVSTTGNDSNPGTYALPWRTIQHAANSARPGDRVYVRGGTYYGSINVPGSGSATTGPIVFQSFPGEQAVIDGSGNAWTGGELMGLVNLIGAHSYIVIEGFEIRNWTSSIATHIPLGILVNGSGTHVQLLNNIIHAITETTTQGSALGIGVYGNGTRPIGNLTIGGNQIYGLKLGWAESILVDGDTDGFTITENHIHDSDNIGIDAVGYWGTGPTGYDHARNGLISRNTLYNLSSLHNPSYAKYAADGIYCDGCSNTIIERNLVYACDQNISASSEIYGQVSSYVTIRNNVLYAANMTGISIGGYTTAGGSDHVVIVNNTILHNTNVGWGNGLHVGAHATNNIFENNIVYATVPGALYMGGSGSTDQSVTSDYNIIYGTALPLQWVFMGTTYESFSAYRIASGHDLHSSFANPGLLSAVYPYNLSLETTSPALATGNYALGAADYGTLDFPGAPRVTGSTISIGAYQH